MAKSRTLKELDEVVAWMQQILAAQQIDGPWLSPAQAAPILGVNRNWILREIHVAEQQRIQRKPSDLRLGVHYRDVRDPSTSKPCWKVNFQEFQKILAIPPDQRKIG